MAKGITIAKLAALAGVSPATISIVLNNRPLAKRIPHETQEKIRGLAEQYDYRPNSLATAMKRQSAGIIGFVCGDIEQPFYAELCSELALAADERGYRLMAMLTRWSYAKEMEALDMLLSRTIDGVVIVTNAFHDHGKQTDRFRKPGTPVVAISDYEDLGVCQVSSDYKPGMEELFCYLRKQGYTRIALADIRCFPPKYEAYLQCIHRYNLSEERYTSDHLEVNYEELADRILKQRPEVVIAYSDYMAMRLIPLLAMRGLRVGEDISVASIDGTYMAKCYNPPLTAIRQDIPALARESLDTLFHRIAGEVQIASQHIPTGLMIGRSVKEC